MTGDYELNHLEQGVKVALSLWPTEDETDIVTRCTGGRGWLVMA